MDSGWSFKCLCLLIFSFKLVQQIAGDSKIICQGSREVINCGKDMIIDVTSATYGRTNVWTCSESASLSTINCGMKDNVLTKVKNECKRKHRCLLNASNKVFTDPCHGTSVYLDVTYTCIKGCNKRQFQCANGNCIRKQQICNGRMECIDGGDERNCKDLGECGIPAIKPIFSQCNRRPLMFGCNSIPHSWPWAVQLVYDRYGNGTFLHECGAALLSPMFALTASHCFLSSRNTDKWRTIAGRHKKFGMEANNQIKKIVKIVSFPRTSINILDQDVTIIKFATPVTINDYVTPVCLPISEPNENDVCVGVGWADPTVPFEDFLKQERMVIINKQICNQTEEFKGEITPYMICSSWQEGGHDACLFDSGGPLVCQMGETYYLQGLATFGVDCANPALPGVYANVFKFVTWIKQQMATL